MAATNGHATAAANGDAGGSNGGSTGGDLRQRKAAAAAAAAPAPAAAAVDGGRGSGAAARGGGWGVGPLLGGVVWTAAWMVCSSLLIILNKSLYQRGFTYPSTVTGGGQLMSALSGLLLAASGQQTLRPPPGPRECATMLLPITLASTATMYFGNLSYLYLSVAFIQILKAFTPALTLLLCIPAGLERFTWPLLASILMIALGTAGAVLVESGTPAFSLLGFAAFMASSLTEAARVVGAELLQGGKKYNTAEQLVYVGGSTAVVLLAVGAAVEGPAMLAAAAHGGGLALVAADPWVFFAAFSMSALVNMTCFLAIQLTSSLTFKVAGCVKNVAVVWYGMVVHAEAVTPLQMGGYGVSVAGFILYSRLKIAAMQQARGKQGEAKGGEAKGEAKGGQQQGEAKGEAKGGLKGAGAGAAAVEAAAGKAVAGGAKGGKAA